MTTTKIVPYPDVSWQELAKGVLVEGESGTGKTHLIAKIAREFYNKAPVWIVTLDPFEDIDRLLEGVPIILNPNPEVQSIFKPGRVYIWAYPVVKGLMPDEWAEKVIISILRAKRERKPTVKAVVMVDPADYVSAPALSALSMAAPRLNIGFVATFQKTPPGIILSNFHSRIVLSYGDQKLGGEKKVKEFTGESDAQRGARREGALRAS